MRNEELLRGSFGPRFESLPPHETKGDQLWTRGLKIGELYYEMMRFADTGLGLREDGREQIRGFAREMKAILSGEEPRGCGCAIPVTHEATYGAGMENATPK